MNILQNDTLVQGELYLASESKEIPYIMEVISLSKDCNQICLELVLLDVMSRLSYANFERVIYDLICSHVA